MKRWLVPAVAAVLFIAVAALGGNAPLFLLLNKLGPATGDWLWANVTLLGDGMAAFALCLPLWRRRDGYRSALRHKVLPRDPLDIGGRDLVHLVVHAGVIQTRLEDECRLVLRHGS